MPGRKIEEKNEFKEKNRKENGSEKSWRGKCPRTKIRIQTTPRK